VEKRVLGRTDVRVAPLCLGGNVFGWTADEATSFAVLDAYLEAGGNFVDTADTYPRWAPGCQGGESEAIIGRWIQARGNRAQVIVATKLGGDMGGDKKGLARGYILAEVEASLRRLETDYIDLYQAHYPDPHTPLDETLGTFDALVRQGKVRAIGASNHSAEQLSHALEVSARHGYVRYESLQPNYNLAHREELERELEPLCRREGLGVIPYWSLAGGFLTGKYHGRDDDAAGPRAGGVRERYFNARGFRVLEAVERVARQVGATPAQVALAWLIVRPSITAPIASATSVEQVRELVGATTLQLDAATIAELDQASDWRPEAAQREE
jgi:aryl-alcohol dehydrogenase-like predicted oxidoreductase